MARWNLRRPRKQPPSRSVCANSLAPCYGMTTSISSRSSRQGNSRRTTTGRCAWRACPGRAFLRARMSATTVGQIDQARWARALQMEGILVTIQGAGLPAAESMRFPLLRCLAWSAQRTVCVGDLGETAEFLCPQRRPSCVVRVRARNRSFPVPFQPEPLQVDLAVGADDAMDRASHCRVYGQRLVNCRK